MEEAHWEVQEQQVAEKLEVRTEAQEGPVPLNLMAQVWTHWRPRVPRPTGPMCIQNIPGFRVTTFLSHPQLSATISPAFHRQRPTNLGPVLSGAR